MAGAIYSSRRKSQPQGAAGIDWANPLTQGLVFLSRPTMLPALSMPELTGIGNMTAELSPGYGLSSVVSQVGCGIAAASKTQSINLPETALNAKFAATGEATVFLLHRSAAQDSTGDQGPANLRNGGANFEHYPFTDGNLYLSTLAGARWVSAVAPGFPLTNPHAFCVTAKSGDQRAYLRGVQVATAARAETPAMAAARLAANGATFVVAFWSRCLTPVEVATLSANPWQLFEPRRIWVPMTALGGGGSVTGTLDASESGSDTAAFSGQIVVQGALAASEAGSDTAAAAGTVLVQGALAATETGSDTAAITGSQSATGNLSATEAGSDTAALAGVVVVQGSLAATESGADTAAVAGQVIVKGSLSATETGSDTAVISGSSSITTTGDLNAAESGSDTAAVTGKVIVQGLLAALESGSDSASVAGQIIVKGALAATETGSDTCVILQAPATYEVRRLSSQITQAVSLASPITPVVSLSSRITQAVTRASAIDLESA